MKANIAMVFRTVWNLSQTISYDPYAFINPYVAENDLGNKKVEI